MKKKYDLVMGMGSMCSCSQALREAKLQLSSFPFDWNGGPGIRGKTDLILSDFAGWLDRQSLHRAETEPKHSFCQWWYGKDNFRFIHDFPASCSIDAELPKVQAKYRRRINRMYDLIGKSKRVLVVYFACPDWEDCSASDADYCRRRLGEKWPEIDFDFLVFRYDPELPFERRRDEISEHCRVVTYDIRNHKEEGWIADFKQIGAWLATQYEAVDYRSEAERMAWDNQEKLQRYARYKAKNWFELVINRLEYKIYKHFRNVLDRKGII